jgi:hypothetical protein
LIVGILFLFFLIYSVSKHVKLQTTGVFILLFSTLLAGQIVIYLFVPKVEKYSQRAMIDFLKSKSEEDCYIIPINYHSYAHHFYAKVTPKTSQGKWQFLEKKFGKNTLGKSSYSQQKEAWVEHLLEEKIDKKAYFLIKKGDESWQKRLRENKKLKLIMDKNGFIAYQRIP